jgi:CheY-like chemotaxis protein
MKKAQILVVEDIVKTINGFLCDLEYNTEHDIKVVGSIEEAIEQLSIKKYDAMILDWRLPMKADSNIEEDGGEILLKQISNNDKLLLNKGIPFLIATNQKAAVDYEILKRYSNCVGTVSKLLHDNMLILLNKCLSK